MDLIDVPEGTEIGIDVTYNGASLRKVTTIAVSRNNILLCDPILDNDNNQLDLGLSQNRCNVRVVLDDKGAMVFTGVVIRTCVWQGDDYIVLANARLAPKTNRRDAYRQYLGLRGNSTLFETTKYKEANIRDISVTGIAFISFDKERYNIDDKVDIQFFDKTINKEISLCVQIVRLNDLDDERVLYGCKILTTDCNLGNYIAIKQSQELSRTA